MTANFDAETQAEVDRIAQALPLDDAMVLATVREAIKDAFLTSSSLQNGGAMVSLGEEATAIWDAAIEKAFNEWLQNR